MTPRTWDDTAIRSHARSCAFDLLKYGSSPTTVSAARSWLQGWMDSYQTSPAYSGEWRPTDDQVRELYVACSEEISRATGIPAEDIRCEF